VLEELDNAAEITRATERLLVVAGVRGRLPTPVDDLVAAADLAEPEESVLSESMLRRAPKHIRDAVVPFRFKVRALLDRKAREIHVAPGIEHPAQRDFKRLHEVVHDILPSQRKLAYADDHKTLSWMTNLRFEQAANQGAAELLFQRELFRQMVADYQIGLAAVVELAETFGASIHAAFRRYVETHRTPVTGIVLDPTPLRRVPPAYQRREAVHSPAWAEQFAIPRCWPSVLDAARFPFLTAADLTPRGAASPRLEVTWPTLDGEPTRLLAESFSNSYRLLLLVWRPRREILKRRRVLVA
jgi:IrrE N-terminal-like domain